MLGLLLALESAAAGASWVRMRFRRHKMQALFWRLPGEQASPVDETIRKHKPVPKNKYEERAIKVADALVFMIRKVAPYQAFKWFVEGLAVNWLRQRRKPKQKGGGVWAILNYVK
jgi:hypothetical protein